jgi:hypothetical protein
MLNGRHMGIIGALGLHDDLHGFLDGANDDDAKKFPCHAGITGSARLRSR